MGAVAAEHIVTVAKGKYPCFDAKIVTADVIPIFCRNNHIAISAPFGRVSAGPATGTKRPAGRVRADMYYLKFREAVSQIVSVTAGINWQAAAQCSAFSQMEPGLNSDSRGTGENPRQKDHQNRKRFTHNIGVHFCRSVCLLFYIFSLAGKVCSAFVSSTIW